MKIKKNVKDNLKEIKKLNGNSPDFNTRYIKVKNKEIGIAFYSSVSSDDKISQFLIKSVVDTIKHSFIFDNVFSNIFNTLNNNIYNSTIKKVDNFKDIINYLSNGFTIVFINGYKKCIAVETKEILDRGVQKSESEITIKGPKDAFTENYNKNIGLIRKRIKDKNLRFEEFIIGRRTKSKVSIAYINDLAEKSRIELIRTKIKNIDIDGILDVGYIRDFLIPDNEAFFPLVLNTERPDLVCANLLEGKIAIIMENTPNALVLPATFDNFMHSPEDSYQKAINITLTRIIRFLAMIVTIATPALYIAITTFNQEVIPDTLLISLAIQRAGVPFPTAFATLILMLTFEMLRESDMRLPEVMGTSISIVGALVLGDAAVNAGLVSPIVVIIVAITSITSLLFTDLDIINAFRWWRLLFIILSSIIGLIGFIIASILLITKLSSLNSFGVPYLIPYSPYNKSLFKEGLITKPHNKLRKRPSYLVKKNKTRLED